MRLALSKYAPPAILLMSAHSTGHWHLDHIHFLLCVSVYSYIHLIPHEECITSIRAVKACGCLCSLHRDSSQTKPDCEPSLVWLLPAECSDVDDGAGAKPDCSVLAALAAAPKLYNCLCVYCQHCHSMSEGTFMRGKNIPSTVKNKYLYMRMKCHMLTSEDTAFDLDVRSNQKS